mmetsp:Transcript_109704/g.318914  ORF Transcript_109704/g.318914 Transcript_109704/m.318914 type:complete len:215 (+) Transcript_109704:927-1571(+)
MSTSFVSRLRVSGPPPSRLTVRGMLMRFAGIPMASSAWPTASSCSMLAPITPPTLSAGVVFAMFAVFASPLGSRFTKYDGLAIHCLRLSSTMVLPIGGARESMFGGAWLFASSRVPVASLPPLSLPFAASRASPRYVFWLRCEMLPEVRDSLTCTYFWLQWRQVHFWPGRGGVKLRLTYEPLISNRCWIVSPGSLLNRFSMTKKRKFVSYSWRV